ncbi:hypothetical protein ABBQ32_007891 [Trebouxia sp. C0010 RCD-2024]
MKLSASSSPNLPAIGIQNFRRHRDSIFIKVRAYNQAGVASVNTSPVGSDLAISVDNLGVGFGVAGARKQVLTGASLQVQQGTFHILLGPNGCGKSTLLRVLGGLLGSDSGSYHISAPVGFVFQNPDNQTFLNRTTHTLSGGQKQRVTIAGALAESPKVLLLDELTTFLDSSDQDSVLKAVRGIVDAQGPSPVTVLWVTHRLEELQWADTASYMEQGKIQFTGAAREVAKYMNLLGAH